MPYSQSFISPEAQNLSESTSIALVQKIERQPIITSFSSEPVTTSYVRQGTGGTPILLLHGFDSSVLEFRRLLPLLALENETWAVDLLGFGFTDRLQGLPFGAKAIATHLYHFWNTQIRQPVILVGASMGGAAAIDFALTYPEAVTKLVLIDSAGLANPPQFLQKLMFPPFDYLATAFLRQPKVRQNISRAAYYEKSLANTDALLCATLHLNLPGWDRALIAFTKSGGYGSFAHRLKEIDQPTLILWGKDDKILGRKDAARFTSEIADSKLVWIENCGHVPHLECPQITARHILSYR